MRITPPRLTAMVGMLAASTAVFASVAVFCWPLLIDDAFLYFRFASHLRAGYGCTWNIGGGPVEGVTSLLWTALLVPFASHPAGVIAAAKMLGIAFAAATVALTACTAALLRGRLAAGLAASLLLLSPLLPFHAASGLETALASAVVAATSLCLARLVHDAGASPRRPRLATVYGVLLWAGALVRPETVLFAIVAAWGMRDCFDHVERRGLAWRAGLGAAIPGALTTGLRYAYFGHLLPLPYHVKIALPSAMSLGYVALTGGALLGGSLSVLAWGMHHELRSAASAPLRALVQAALVTVLGLLVTRPMMGYVFRFAVPFWPVLILGAAAGLSRCWLQGNRRAVAGVGALLVAYHGTAALPVWHQVRVVTPAMTAVHVAFGRTLAAVRNHGRLLALNDVGAAAFYSGWETFEGAGLVTPAVSLQRRNAAWLIDQLAPDVILLAQCRTEKLGAARGYVRVATIPWLVLWGASSDYQCVYCRVDDPDRTRFTARLEQLGYAPRPAPWYFGVYAWARGFFRLSPARVPPRALPAHQNG